MGPPLIKGFLSYIESILRPSPRLGSPGVRGKMCVIKKGRALENEVKKGRGTAKWRNESD